MDIRIGTGDRDIGGMGPGNPVTITTAGTAGKQSRPCEGGCRMSGIRWLTLLLLLLGLSGSGQAHLTYPAKTCKR